MSESTLPPVIAKELEDYVKLDSKQCPEFFKDKPLENGYKVVLFQVPKDVLPYNLLAVSFK